MLSAELRCSVQQLSIGRIFAIADGSFAAGFLYMCSVRSTVERKRKKKQTETIFLILVAHINIFSFHNSTMFNNIYPKWERAT